jgi:hypothetical protein
MCARDTHSAATIAVCEALLPLHSSATSVARPQGPKAALARVTGPPQAHASTLPPLLAVFCPTPQHTPAHADLVRLLVAQQPAGAWRSAGVVGGVAGCDGCVYRVRWVCLCGW